MKIFLRREVRVFVSLTQIRLQHYELFVVLRHHRKLLTDMDKLTTQEEEAMRGIWKIGPCVLRDLLAVYPDPKPPYTTLASVVKNLERKHYVRAQRVGNVYLYHATVQPGDYKRACMSGIVSNLFGNSYKELVSFFARDEKISADDLKDIINMIEQQNTEK